MKPKTLLEIVERYSSQVLFGFVHFDNHTDTQAEFEL